MPTFPRFPAPTEGILLTHFIVSDDVERSRRFYTEVLGGETVREGEPTYVALANGWIIINVGFLNLRVADIHALYAEWSARGAEFLTPPIQRETEIRCYIRDPDGYLIEVGQTTKTP
jgi:catechol 2,3-dioxygenase-like lactoylglutathione lyase family enzyme